MTVVGDIVSLDLTPACSDGQVLTVRIELPSAGFKYFIYFMFVFTFFHFFLYICTFIFIGAAIFYVAHSCVTDPGEDEKEIHARPSSNVAGLAWDLDQTHT